MTVTTVRNYRDLRVWRIAMDLVEASYRATDSFPAAERYGLVSQMRRAAVSIASNIAEGHSRALGDYVRHLYIAAGSLTELETQLILSGRLGFLGADPLRRLLLSCDHLGRMITVLRKRLQSRRTTSAP